MASDTSRLLSASTLQEALEAVAEGVVIADPDGRFVLFNQAAERILGIGALASDPESWPREYGLYLPDTVSAFPPSDVPLARALAGEDTDAVEMFVRNPNKPSGLRIEVSGRSIRSADRQILGGVVIFRDVTELREKQAALERSNSSLRDFVSVASHDLRGPLAAVLGFASTMQKTWEKISDDEKRHYTEIIERQARTAMALCEDLLTISRIEAGDVKAHVIDLPLAGTIADAIEAMSELQDAVTVVCDTELTARCDPLHFQRMLTNYLSNAVRYGDPPFTVSVRTENGTVKVEVSDNGPGVPESVIPRLFGRFCRGENAVPGSTGLGLSIVKGLARSNGGDAYYDSSRKGACFVLALPRS